MKTKHSILKSVIALLMVLAMAATMAVPAMANGNHNTISVQDADKTDRDNWYSQGYNAEPNHITFTVTKLRMDSRQQLLVTGMIVNNMKHSVDHINIKNLSLYDQNGTQFVNNATIQYSKDEPIPGYYSNKSITFVVSDYHFISSISDFRTIKKVKASYDVTYRDQSQIDASSYQGGNFSNLDDGLTTEVFYAYYKDGALMVETLVHNPEERAYNYHHCELSVYADGNKIGHGTFDENVIVPARSTIHHTFKFEYHGKFQTDYYIPKNLNHVKKMTIGGDFAPVPA